MRKNVLFILLIYMYSLTVFSCNMLNPVTLPGKIAVVPVPNNSDTCRIYINSDWPKIKLKLRDDKEVQYGSFTWLNKEDNFLGSENIPGAKIDEYKVNIAKFDLSGKFTERIYEAEKGEQAWVRYSSKDDKYLLFLTQWNVRSDLSSNQGTRRKAYVNIMDLAQKKVIKIIDSSEKDPNFRINETPWLNGGDRFVYSILLASKSMSEDKNANLEKVDSAGIYIYDVSTGKRKFLVAGGDFAIASPVSNQIAYRAERSIKVLDLNNNEEKTIYKIGKKENVMDIHWTPDGKCIYMAHIVNYIGISDIFDSYGEKLIEVSTGKEIAFKKIGHGFNYYTWK